MRKFADYTTRCAEDDRACSSLGAEVRRLGQIERAFRPPYLTGWSFFDTRAGFTTRTRVRDVLEPLAELAPTRVLIPFGIGNHVDHVETMLAAIDFAIDHDWLS